MGKKSIVKGYTEYPWKEEEIVAIIEGAINKLINEPDFIYTSFYIASKRLPRSTLSDWCGRSPLVKNTHSMMREMSEAKVAQELLKKNSTSQVNTIGGLFLLKAQYGWVEEQHRKVDPTTVSQETIEVGFVDDED